MNKLLLLLLLMPIVSFGDFDEYGRSAGGFSLLPDFLIVPIMFLIVGFVLLQILLLPYYIYQDKKQENQHKKYLKKMKSRLKKIGMPDEQITDDECRKYCNWLLVIEGNQHFKKLMNYKSQVIKEEVDMKYVKKLLKLCDASTYGKINWYDE